MAILTRPDCVMKLMETNLLAPKPHSRNSNAILHFVTHILGPVCVSCNYHVNQVGYVISVHVMCLVCVVYVHQASGIVI
jgi:hypothetical protein